MQRLEGVRVRCTVTLHSKVSSNYAEKPVMQRKDRLMTKSESELVKCSVFLASLHHVHAHRLIRSVCLIRYALSGTLVLHVHVSDKYTQ